MIDDLNSNLTNIGETVAININSCAAVNNAETVIGTLKLTKGKWLLTGYVWTVGSTDGHLLIKNIASAIGGRCINISGYKKITATTSFEIIFTPYGADETVSSGLITAIRVS